MLAGVSRLCFQNDDVHNHERGRRFLGPSCVRDLVHVRYGRPARLVLALRMDYLLSIAE